jgi:hypothetical protein
VTVDPRSVHTFSHLCCNAGRCACGHRVYGAISKDVTHFWCLANLLFAQLHEVLVLATLIPESPAGELFFPVFTAYNNISREFYVAA